MIIAFSACHRDWFECKRLIDWCRELDSYSNHTALIVFGKQLTVQQELELIAAAKACEFKSVNAIKQKQEDGRGWPFAPNQMFQGAMKWIEDVGRAPFLWLESDATPLRSGWLDAIEEEYLKLGRPFMGTVFDWISATRYLPHLTGVAVYPPNFRRLNPYPLEATNIPWDVTRPDLTLPRTNKSALFHHEWGDRVTNVPPTFPDDDSVNTIPSAAVLFHRCKDGTLIDRLRENRTKSVPLNEAEPYPVIPITRKIIGLLAAPFIGRPKRKTIRVRRLGAFGDAIAATCVAEKLFKQGFDVIWQAQPVVQSVLKLCPALKAVEDPCEPCDVILDGVYENHPDRTRKPFWEIFVESANVQLSKRGVFLDSSIQCSPRLEVSEKVKFFRGQKLFHHPKPWVFICPRSNSFVNRTIPDEVWAKSAESMKGTKFWLASHPAPSGIIDLNCKTMAEAAEWLSIADLLLTVDTGPLHMAGALGIPIVALLQSSSPELHLTDQRDFEVIAPAGLDCLNCQKNICPIDAVHPPCQLFDPWTISGTVNRKLGQYLTESVSAVVTAYRPPAERLNRCLAALINQVAEVVVTLNADGIIPEGAMSHPKIRYVKTRLPSIGYGRNANFGARHTSGKYILFLNDDVFLDTECVSKLMQVLQTNANAGMAGHLLRYPNGTIQHGGTKRNPGDLGWGHVSHRKTHPEITQIVECENVTHASVLMRRRAFYDAGGYDEQYFMYYEDNALSLQMRRSGWRIFYTPFATAIHDEHQTLNSLPTPQMAENLKRSRRTFDRDWGAYFKNNPPGKLGTFNYQTL